MSSIFLLKSSTPRPDSSYDGTKVLAQVSGRNICRQNRESFRRNRERLARHQGAATRTYARSGGADRSLEGSN